MQQTKPAQAMELRSLSPVLGRPEVERGSASLRGTRLDSRMRLNPIMHRSTRTAIAAVLLSSAWWGQEAAVAASGTLAITDVTLIDCTGRPAQPHVTVVVVDGRIAAVTPADRAQVPDGAESVSGTKRFLIPGLHDMHLHLGDYAEGKQALPILVANGITGVRDMGSPLDDILRLRNETASGMLLGPRMVVAGLLVQGPLDE